MDYDFSHIEQYIRGEMTAQEVATFESAMRERDSLRADVQSYQDMQDFLKSESSIDTSISALDEVHQEFTTDTSTKKSSPGRLKKILLLVALVTLTALIFYFIFSKPVPQEPSVLYATHFEPEAMSLTSRGGEDAILSDIGQSYEEGDYESVLLKTNRSGLVLESYPRLQYIQGISMLATGNTTQTRATLLSLSRTDVQYKDDAHWYVALSYLMDGDAISALRYFRMIPEGNKRYKVSVDLIDELEDYLESE